MGLVIAWLVKHARALLEAGALVAVGLAVVSVFGRCHTTPPEPPVIQTLQVVNAALGKQVDSLQAANTRLTAIRVTLSAQRDSLQRVSTAATHRITTQRAALPAPDAVPDAELRADYSAALVTIDSALTELTRRDHIESSLRVDSALAAQQHVQDTASLNLRAIQITTVQAEAAQWKAQAQAGHPLCGRKCGIVLGVFGTIGAAYALHSVIH